MIMTKKTEKPVPKRVRPRTGYVMVELNIIERERLDELVEQLSAKTHTRSNKAAVIRYLILEKEIS